LRENLFGGLTMQKVKRSCELSAILTILCLAGMACKDGPVEPPDNSDKEIVWQQTALDSLPIYDLANSPGVGIFAAPSVFGELALTSDAGRSWTQLGRREIGKLAISPNGDIFAVTPAAIGGGLFLRSTDNGRTWGDHIGPNGANISAIAFNHNQELFIGSRITDESLGGIYKSSDNGETWAKLNLPDSISLGAIAFPEPEAILVGVSRYGFFRSNDDGTSWRRISSGIAGEGRYTSITNIVIHPVTGVFFAIADGLGIYRSTNAGESWQLTNAPLGDIISIIIGSSGYLYASSANVVPNNEQGVVVSKDNGETWTAVNSGLPTLNISALTIDGEGYIYAGTFGDGTFGQGVFRTTQAGL